MLSNEKHFRPLPNWVDPRGTKAPRYRVVDSNGISGVAGATDKGSGLMFVPLDEDGRMIVNHEMGHVAWSPVAPPEAKTLVNDCYIALEEARVNMGLDVLGHPLKFRKAGGHVKDFRAVLRRPHSRKSRDVVFSMLSLFGTDIEAEVWKQFRDNRDLTTNEGSLSRDRLNRIERIVMDARDRMNKAFMRSKGVVPPQPVMMALARWLAKRLASAHKAHKKKGGGSSFIAGAPQPKTLCGYGKPTPTEPKDRGRPSQKGLRAWGPPRDERLKSWMDGETYRDPENIRLNGFPMPYTGEVMPGRMMVSEPARPLPCAAIKDHKKRTWSAAEEGTQIGDVYRIITDQRVFKRKLKRKRGGGTVLFDISGSMGSLAECINEVVAGNPTATTCATYCGDDTHGILKVVVRDGTKVKPDDMDPQYGGNVVDLPAVDWLSRQPEPRVWVTDQGVTGQNDEASPALLRMCLKLCDAHNISIVESPHDVAKFLKEWSDGMTNVRPHSRWLDEDE